MKQAGADQSAVARPDRYIYKTQAVAPFRSTSRVILMLAGAFAGNVKDLSRRYRSEAAASVPAAPGLTEHSETFAPHHDGVLELNEAASMLERGLDRQDHADFERAVRTYGIAIAGLAAQAIEQNGKLAIRPMPGELAECINRRWRDIGWISTRLHNVFGAILDKWAETGWAAGPLGFPTGSEAGTPDGVGRFNEFQNGSIFYRPEIGAHEIHGAIHQRWSQVGRETFGYPITDEGETSDGVGRYQHFRAFLPQGGAECSIFWKPTSGAHEVCGAIHSKWTSMGYETGSLGYPTDAEAPMPGGRIQHFEHGAIVFTAEGGAVVQ